MDKELATKRVLTGTRPSGQPHLGNAFGAYLPAIELQSQVGELFFFLADYHSLNSVFDPEEMRSQSYDIIATMLALGLDPNKGCFYLQSAVPQLCELQWILSCVSPFGMLTRAHTFKDAEAKGVEINCGVFNYPLLMAADILLFGASLVPVGKDQKQHLEMCRDFALRFHHRYQKEIFTLPEALIQEHVAIVPGLDGEKMSKSKGNVIPVFAEDKLWKKAIARIVTDSKGVDEKKDPENCIVFRLYRLIEQSQSKVEALKAKYLDGGYGYGHAKQDLLASMTQRFGPQRDRYFKLRSREKDLYEIIMDGSAKARTIAAQNIQSIRSLLGVL
jgi:tryptophanyl-tRNA synthetase